MCFPAERRDMGKQIIADNLTLGTQLSHSAIEINGKQRREARGLLSVCNIGFPRSCPNPSNSRRVNEADDNDRLALDFHIADSSRSAQISGDAACTEFERRRAFSFGSALEKMHTISFEPQESFLRDRAVVLVEVKYTARGRMFGRGKPIANRSPHTTN
jgi:hypothetical protein